MLGNKDAVQLSEYCFDACGELKAMILWKNVDDLNKSVKMALEDLRRYVGELWPRRW